MLTWFESGNSPFSIQMTLNSYVIFLPTKTLPIGPLGSILSFTYPLWFYVFNVTFLYKSVIKFDFHAFKSRMFNCISLFMEHGIVSLLILIVRFKAIAQPLMQMDCTSPQDLVINWPLCLLCINLMFSRRQPLKFKCIDIFWWRSWCTCLLYSLYPISFTVLIVSARTINVSLPITLLLLFICGQILPLL